LDKHIAKLEGTDGAGAAANARQGAKPAAVDRGLVELGPGEPGAGSQTINPKPYNMVGRESLGVEPIALLKVLRGESVIEIEAPRLQPHDIILSEGQGRVKKDDRLHADTGHKQNTASDQEDPSPALAGEGRGRHVEDGGRGGGEFEGILVHGRRVPDEIGQVLPTHPLPSSVRPLARVDDSPPTEARGGGVGGEGGGGAGSGAAWGEGERESVGGRPSWRGEGERRERALRASEQRQADYLRQRQEQEELELRRREEAQVLRRQHDQKRARVLGSLQRIRHEEDAAKAGGAGVPLRADGRLLLQP